VLKTKEKIREQIKWFFLFHLGFDAQVLIRDERDEMEVSVQHDRIRNLTFRLSGAEMEAAIQEPAQLEDFLLEQLNRHRQ
jgi:hypothetical protein